MRQVVTYMSSKIDSDLVFFFNCFVTLLSKQLMNSKCINFFFIEQNLYLKYVLHVIQVNKCYISKFDELD